MKVQDWIVSVRFNINTADWRRYAVVGPARASTVEAVLHLAAVPEFVRVEIRGHKIVQDFIDGRLDPDKMGYYVERDLREEDEENKGLPSWLICIGSIQEVLR
jgi:hypothetical protein